MDKKKQTTPPKKKKTADELADVILERRVRARERAYKSFEAKCNAAIEKMVADMDGYTVVEDLTKEDLLALDLVTESLRNHGYKFKFVEKVDFDRTSYELIISLEHLLADDYG